MKKISIFLLAIGAFFAVSCDQGFEEMNTDPNRPAEVPAHLLLANTLRQTQSALYNVQQGGDMGMCWAQQWSKVQYNDEERYIPRRGAIDNVWAVLYSTVIYDAKVMHDLAVKEGNTNLQAVSLIVQANAFQILTDLYGPVPFTEAGIKGNLSPKFDSQEVVYDGVLAMLTEADALLAANVGDIVPTSDVVYAGNALKWRKLANSLKLKALMRISAKRTVSAEVAGLVASGMLMSSNADSANIFNLAAADAQNPFVTTLATRLEYKVSSVLVSNLTALADPRLAVFAKPVGTAYVGNVPGVASLNYAGTSAVGTFYNSATLPGVILSYAQVELYLAEAALHGMIAGGVATSQAHLKNGISANMAFNEVSPAEAATYLTNPVFTSYTDAASGDPVIGNQMWLSLYGQGFEAWTEWRRTKFPALTAVANHDVSVPTIPSRLFYSTVSENVNQTNFAAAVALIPGGNELTSKVWWML